jgi:hypothetical protein
MSFEIIDGDGHVTETSEQIARYLDEPYRRRPLQTPLFPQDAWDRRLIGTKGNWAGDGKSWIEALDSGGMSTAVLFPTLGLFAAFLRDAEWAVALCRAYNTMLSKEFTSVSPRLKGVALLPLQDPKAAADELRRAVRELGLVGAMLAADGYYLLGHERFDPIYAAAQELGVPVTVHAGGTDMGVAGHEPFPKFIQAHSCSHVFAQLRQITSVIFNGVLVRFPQLKIAFLEAGCGWVPFFVQRLDEEWEKRGHIEAKLLTKSPTQYIRESQVYFSCEADEPLLPQALAYVPPDRIMYASDFPHWDHSYPKSVKELADRGDISDAQKASVLSGTARRLYAL